MFSIPKKVLHKSNSESTLKRYDTIYDKIRSYMTFREINENPVIASALTQDKKITFNLLTPNKSKAIPINGLKNEKKRRLVDRINSFRKSYFNYFKNYKYSMDEITNLQKENSLQKDIQGFITKDLDAAEIERAILCVNDGNLFYCKEAKAILHELIQNKAGSGGGFYSGSEGEQNTEVLFKNYQMLTQKEQEVFALLAQKKDVDEVADMLNKSVKTIQNKKTLIYQKMNVKDRLELVEAAKLLGVII